MGQRHQIFLVAQVAGQWRTLAITHHQWLYGINAVAKCAALLRIVRANAPAMRNELHKASTFDWTELRSLDEEACEPPITEHERICVFPCANTAGVVAASHLVPNPEGFESRSALMLPIESRPEECDNDDGFTVVDVSDPDRPRYCFFFIEDRYAGARTDEQTESEDDDDDEEDDEELVDEEGDDQEGDKRSGRTASEAQHPTQLSRFCHRPKKPVISKWEPVSYYRYAKCYGDWLVAGLWYRKLFRQFRLLEVEDLQSIWSDRPIVAEQAGPGAGQGDVQTPLPLRQRALGLLSDLSKALLDCFAQQPGPIHHPSDRESLKRAMEGKDGIDLSHVIGLQAGDVLHVLGGTRSAGEVTLWLPNMDQLTPSELNSIVSAARITRLHLGYTESLPLQEVLNIHAEQNLTEITHPEMYAAALQASLHDDLPSYSVAEALANANKSHDLSQVIFFLRNSEGVSVAPFVLRMDPGQESKDTTNLFTVPLRDVLIPTHDLIRQIPQATCTVWAKLFRPDGSWLQAGAGRSIAHRLALRVRLESIERWFLDEPNPPAMDYRLSPLPIELFSSYMKLGRSSAEPLPKARPIISGEWTLAICQGRHGASIYAERRDLRYSFVSKSPAGEIIHLSVEDFLRAATTPVDAEDPATAAKVEETARIFQRGFRGAGFGFGACDVDEVREFVEAIDVWNDEIDAFVVKNAASIAASIAARGGFLG